MAESLNELERRVLGVLLEKSLGQPDYYPMRLNAVVAACNQKQNRDPVMELDEDLVRQTLDNLRERGLVSKLLPAPGARVERYRHEVESHFGWQKRERAVMAELLLRGPQTTGELRTRCSRLVPFENLEAVAIVLECLGGYDPPMAAALPRVPGQSAVRYTHLLYEEGEQPSEATTATAASSGPPPAASGMQDMPAGAAAELENLQAEVADLHESLAELRRRVETLEAKWT